MKYIGSLSHTLFEAEQSGGLVRRKRRQAATKRSIDAAEDWLDPRLMLGAAHYDMKEYRAAKEAYAGVMALDREHESAKSYLASVSWYLARSDAGTGNDLGDGEP